MSVKSSRDVFAVLQQLAIDGGPVSAAEMAKTLSLPLTTAVRAFATLEAAGYAERHNGSTRFVIGKSARTLAFAFMAQFPIRDLVLPYLQQTTLESGETSSLFIRLGWSTVRIATILGPQVLIHCSPMGETRSLLVGAPSLAVLAFLTPEDIDKAAAQAKLSATRTREAMAQCRRVVRDGFCVAPNLVDGGTVDLAIPLFDRNDRAVAAIAFESVPTERLRKLQEAGGRIQQIIQELKAKIRSETAVAMSHYDHVDPDKIELESGKF